MTSFDCNTWEGFNAMLKLLLDFKNLSKANQDFIMEFMETKNKYNTLINRIEMQEGKP